MYVSTGRDEISGCEQPSSSLGSNIEAKRLKEDRVAGIIAEIRWGEGFSLRTSMILSWYGIYDTLSPFFAT